MKEIGNLSGAQLASGIGGSQKLEQTKPEDENYSFNDALLDRETDADKTEKKDMQKQDIVKTESQEEVNKKEYQKFLERQNMLLNNDAAMNPALLNQQMANKNSPLMNQMNFQNMFSSGNQISNQGEVGLRDLRKLMVERGISFNQLGAEEMVKLSTMHSRVEVTSFLNQLAKKMRDENKNLTASNPQVVLEKMQEKDKKVNETEDARKLADKPDKDLDKLREASAAADNLDKLQGTPLSNFFGQAAFTEFKPGSMMEKQIMEQVLQKMEINTEKAKSEVAIKLNPEYLGEVKLKMTVDKDKGTVSVNFKTTSRAAKDALKGNLEGLEEAFAAAGLKMDKFEVSLEDELT